MFYTESKKKQNPPKQILMSVNDGFEYKTPVLLLSALKVIENLPSSMILKDNYIMFENQQKEIINFKRIFNNKWIISIIFDSIEENSMSIEYKYLSTNIVSVIVINFFQGNYIGKSLKMLETPTQYQKLRSIINKISTLLPNWLICRYCGTKNAKLYKLNCDYCKEDLDISDFYIEF